MSKYYYLIAGLPDLTLEDNKLNYTIQSFREELYSDLSRADQKLLDLLYLQIDNRNLLSLLNDADFEPRKEGLYSKDQLLQLIQIVKIGEEKPIGYVSYLIDFLTSYFGDRFNDVFLLDNTLTGLYYDYALKVNNKFVRDWFQFNQILNNLFIALSARKHSIEYKDQLIGDDLITQQIKESNARDFGLSTEVDYLNQVSRLVDEEDLALREKQMDQLRWNWLEDNSFFHYFSVERLFVFLQQVEMIERWLLLDKEEGNKYFRKIIDSLRNDVQLPAEFRQK